MTATQQNDYFEPGPVSTGGAYERTRGWFDGTIGVLDGVASAANSIGHTVQEVADMRVTWAGSQAAWDDVILSRQERRQAMELAELKAIRGDNRHMYYAAGAAALAAIVLLK